MATWIEQVHQQGLVLLDQIVLLRSAPGIAQSDRAALIARNQERLASLYSTQLPLASVMDRSDLVFHAEGPSAKEFASVSGSVAWLCAEAERRLRQLGLSALGLTGEAAEAAEADIRILLNGLAPGSLYLGFSVASARMESTPGGEDLLGSLDSDSLIAVRSAIKELPEIPRFVGDQTIEADVVEAFEDPGVRDALLMAAFHLAPTGKRGIHTIQISSPGSRSPSSALTNRERVVLRETAVRRPLMRKTKEGSFVGEFREVDLDTKRFQLRNVGGDISTLRCAMAHLSADLARSYIGRGVRVEGLYEEDRHGRPRLLEVQSISLFHNQQPLI
jgi:hypothetical protein